MKEVSVFPTRILLATDGSSEAARAARMAVGISNELDSELHVVNVGVAPSIYAPAESEILDFELYPEIRQRVEEEARTRLAEELGVGHVILGSRGLGP
jgi:nucleotide-binding universal stress UspA family protein